MLVVCYPTCVLRRPPQTKRKPQMRGGDFQRTSPNAHVVFCMREWCRSAIYQDKFGHQCEN
jgi:hypothetical protein